jgi:hypothetical protein
MWTMCVDAGVGVDEGDGFGSCVGYNKLVGKC